MICPLQAALELGYLLLLQQHAQGDVLELLLPVTIPIWVPVALAPETDNNFSHLSSHAPFSPTLWFTLMRTSKHIVLTRYITPDIQGPICRPEYLFYFLLPSAT